MKVTGEGIKCSVGTVISVSDQNNEVTVELNQSADQADSSPTYSNTVKVPISRIQPVRSVKLCEKK